MRARGLRIEFGKSVALDGLDFELEEGRILGLIVPNGAGKTTALYAILGLLPYKGELKVLGRDPWSATGSCAMSRSSPMLPRCHAGCEFHNTWTMWPACIRDSISRPAREFSRENRYPERPEGDGILKGQVTHLHLALIMAIDAKLLVLDEPTLGL